MSLKIAIPSKARPWKSNSKELLQSAVLFVPESEKDLYFKVYKEIEPVPNNIKGITQTRNYILNFFKGQEVVMCDDDLENVGYWTNKTDGGRRQEKIKEESILIYEFQKYFELCEELKYKIWGLKTEASKIAQHDEKPIDFRSYVTASMMGIIADGSYLFNENYLLKEDYEICLRHIRNEGGILKINYIYWQNKHWDKNGGCGDYRNDQMEKKMISMLIKDYPGMIKQVNRKNSQYCIRLML